MNRATSPTGWAKNPDGSQGYTWNPITGCLNHDNGLCKGGGFPCYAYKLANGRLKPLYLANIHIVPSVPADNILNPFYPRFWHERVREEFGAKSAGAIPKGIFVCDMGDLFGQGIPEEWTRRVLSHIGMSWYSEHRFYLLTKQPQNLIKFSPFPENCWVGVTVTNEAMMQPAYEALDCVVAKVKYISLEPLLSPLSGANIKLIAGAEYYKWLDWLIIGACTGTYSEMEHLAGLTRLERDYDRIKPCGKIWTLQPPIAWLQGIVDAADKAGVKVFLKDNLRPLLETLDITETNFGRLTSLKSEAIKDAQDLPRQRGWYELRQELPE